MLLVRLIPPKAGWLDAAISILLAKELQQSTEWGKLKEGILNWAPSSSAALKTWPPHAGGWIKGYIIPFLIVWNGLDIR